MDDQVWETNLISELEKRPAIWLPSHENHKKNRVVGALWREIASIVNININTLKGRWKVLKDTYEEELKIIMDPMIKISTSMWPHFHSMSFYKTVALRNSQPSGNVTESINTLQEESINKSYASARETYQNSLARSHEIKSPDTFTNTNNIVSTNVSRPGISGNTNTNKNDEYFFDNLLYWSALVTGNDKLDMRIEMLRLVKSFTFTNEQDESSVQDETDKEFYSTLIPYTSRVINKRKMELQSAIINLLKKFAFYETDQDTVMMHQENQSSQQKKTTETSGSDSKRFCSHNHGMGKGCESRSIVKKELEDDGNMVKNPIKLERRLIKKEILPFNQENKVLNDVVDCIVLD